jgi:hypothetical protein
VKGTCTCTGNWVGDYCDKRCLSDWEYWNGLACERCLCARKNTLSCNSTNGDCTCLAGWSPPTCSHRCPAGTFGDGCQNKCQCKNNAHCDPVDGSCTCRDGFNGTV